MAKILIRNLDDAVIARLRQRLRGESLGFAQEGCGVPPSPEASWGRPRFAIAPQWGNGNSILSMNYLTSTAMTARAE